MRNLRPLSEGIHCWDLRNKPSYKVYDTCVCVCFNVSTYLAFYLTVVLAPGEYMAYINVPTRRLHGFWTFSIPWLEADLIKTPAFLQVRQPVDNANPHRINALSPRFEYKLQLPRCSHEWANINCQARSENALEAPGTCDTRIQPPVRLRSIVFTGLKKAAGKTNTSPKAQNRLAKQRNIHFVQEPTPLSIVLLLNTSIAYLSI